MKRQIECISAVDTDFFWLLPIELLVEHVIADDRFVFGRLLCSNKQLAQQIVAYRDGGVFYRLFKAEWPDQFCCLYELVLYPELFAEPIRHYGDDAANLRDVFGYDIDVCSPEHMIALSMEDLVRLDYESLLLANLGGFVAVSRRAVTDTVFASRLAAYWPASNRMSIAPWEIYMHWHHQIRRMVVACLARLNEFNARQREMSHPCLTRISNSFMDALYREDLVIAMMDAIRVIHVDDILPLLMNDALLVLPAPPRLDRDTILSAWQSIVVPFMCAQGIESSFCEETDWLPSFSDNDAAIGEKRFIDTIDEQHFKERLAVRFSNERPESVSPTHISNCLTELADDVRWAAAFASTQPSCQHRDNVMQLYQSFRATIEAAVAVELYNWADPPPQTRVALFFRLLFEYYVRK